MPQAVCQAANPPISSQARQASQAVCHAAVPDNAAEREFMERVDAELVMLRASHNSEIAQLRATVQRQELLLSKLSKRLDSECRPQLSTEAVMPAQAMPVPVCMSSTANTLDGSATETSNGIVKQLHDKDAARPAPDEGGSRSRTSQLAHGGSCCSLQADDPLDPEDVTLEESIWAVVILAGTKPMGQMASILLGFLFLANLCIQGLFICESSAARTHGCLWNGYDSHALPLCRGRSAELDQPHRVHVQHGPREPVCTELAIELAAAHPLCLLRY